MEAASAALGESMEAASAAVEESMEAAVEEEKGLSKESRAILAAAVNRILDLQEKGPVPEEVEAAILAEAKDAVHKLESRLLKLEAEEGAAADDEAPDGESSELEEDLSANAAAAADAEAADAKTTLAELFPFF
jgi:hypothetical protein